MGNPIKVKYKFGQIEFEAEGDSLDVEKQRDYFMNTIIPVATNIVNRLPTIEAKKLNDDVATKCLDANKSDSVIKSINKENLISFIKDYKVLSDKDFTLFAAFYHEQESDSDYAFTSEDVKNYFKEARRPASKNYSDILHRLVKSGLIMDADNPEGKIPKPYQITQSGISYIKEYTPKEHMERKRKNATTSSKKFLSVYSTLNSEQLNLEKYPSLKSLQTAKEQIIMIMYIITKEEKGKWFLAADVEYIALNIFNLRISLKQVKNFFDRNRNLLTKQKSEKNKNAYEYRLLSNADDFAQEVIKKNMG